MTTVAFGDALQWFWKPFACRRSWCCTALCCWARAFFCFLILSVNLRTTRPHANVLMYSSTSLFLSGALYFQLFLFETHLFWFSFYFFVLGTLGRVSSPLSSIPSQWNPFFFLNFLRSVSLWSPGTHYVDEAGFELRDPPAPAFWVLRCTPATMI